MARIRTIKPEFCSSADTGALSRDARLFFLQLLTEADDDGRLLWLPRRLCGVLYPFDEDVGGTELEAWAAECQARGMVQLYTVDGVRYLAITNWDKHQRINRATPSKLPPPSEVSNQGGLGEGSGTTHGGLSEDVHRERNREGNREQGTGKGKGTGEGLGLPLGLPAADAADAASNPAGNVAQLNQDEKVVEIVLDCYHRILPKCQRVAALTPKRRKRILAANKLARDLCRRQGWQVSVREFWTGYFEECEDDAWLRGDVPNPNNPRWKQNLHVLLDEDRFAQIMDQAVAKLRADQAGAA